MTWRNSKAGPDTLELQIILHLIDSNVLSTSELPADPNNMQHKWAQLLSQVHFGDVNALDVLLKPTYNPLSVLPIV